MIEKYELLNKQTVCTAQNGANSVNMAVPVNELYPILGRTTAYVEAFLSVAGAVDVAVLLYDLNRAPIGIAAPGVQTMTATGYTLAAASSDYAAPVAGFDLAGAAFYEVRSADATNSATRTLTTWMV